MLLKKANPGIVHRKTMKLPASYLGAYGRALIAAGSKPRRLNTVDDAGVSDSEPDVEDPITPGSQGRIQMLKTRSPSVTPIDEPHTSMTIGAQHLCRPVPSTSTRNAFQAFADNHHELDDETITALNGWATCVYCKTARNTKAAIALNLLTSLVNSQ